MLQKVSTAGVISILCDKSGPGTTPVAYQVSKNGTGFYVGAGTITTQPVTIAGSAYVLAALAFTATDVDTVGDSWLQIIDLAGDILGAERVNVVAFDPANSANLGLSLLDVAVSTRLSGTLGSVVLSNPEREAIAATVLGLSNGVDVGVSLAHACMAMAAVLAGKTNVVGDTVTFRNWQDTKSRVTVKTNVSGRYLVTYDFS